MSLFTTVKSCGERERERAKYRAENHQSWVCLICHPSINERDEDRDQTTVINPKDQRIKGSKDMKTNWHPWILGILFDLPPSDKTLTFS